MFLTSSLYFLVAIFGGSIESSEAHGLQIVEGQEDETTESGHNEASRSFLFISHRASNDFCKSE
jgi:hypothetical protein